MVLDAPGRAPRAAELPVPEPGPGQLLLRVLDAASAAPISTSSTASFRTPGFR